MTHRVHIDLRSIDGKVLSGGRLELRDHHGVVVESWASGNLHAVGPLLPGAVYTLHEVVAPDGYVRARDIVFNNEREDKEQRVSMVNKIMWAERRVGKSAILSGARMLVRDESGVTLDAWTSTHDAHPMCHLEEGRTYILYETDAPQGIMPARPVTFTVHDHKQPETIVLTSVPHASGARRAQMVRG